MQVYRKHSIRKCFTLFELIFVMVLISIVMTMAAPYMQGFVSGRRLNDEASRILAMTMHARSQAISEAATHRIVFDQTARSYQLTRQDGASFVELDSSLGREYVVPQRVTLTFRSDETEGEDGDDIIQFYSDGTSDEATIVLTDIKNQTLYVSCRSATEPFAILNHLEDQADQ